MVIYTNSKDYANTALGEKPDWHKTNLKSQCNGIQILADNLFARNSIFEYKIEEIDTWKYLFIAEFAEESQYDTLIRISQSGVHLPDGILCLSGSGKKFHGFKNRHWVSIPGNIHLSVYLSPQQIVNHFASGFLIISALSVIRTIDSMKEFSGKAYIKWINDILIDSAKVCGVLAYTQTMGKVVTGAILGIGINVETTPIVPADTFTPKVASLADFYRNNDFCTQDFVFRRLIQFLSQNYRLLLNGSFDKLLAQYRERSIIIGKTVQIFADTPEADIKEIARGKVIDIGNDLELLMENAAQPIYGGRVVLPTKNY